MADVYAHDLHDIPVALSKNKELREAVIALVETQPIAAKVLEGGDRLEKEAAALEMHGRKVMDQNIEHFFDEPRKYVQSKNQRD
ncbi:MAG: hypothetical protein IH941_05335 [Acidobacteria bacterium]|nr:hypothetical protein [Acidobacteriota bacterium]